MGDTTIEYLDAVKLILDIHDEANDELLTLLIDDTVSMVLSHCRIEVLPRQLEALIPQIAARLYRNNMSGGVRSVTEGERRVEYTDGANDALFGFYDRLKPFVSRAVSLPSEIGR